MTERETMLPTRLEDALASVAFVAAVELGFIWTGWPGLLFGAALYAVYHLRVLQRAEWQRLAWMVLLSGLLGVATLELLARMWFPGLAKDLDLLSWSNAFRLSGLAAMLVGGRVFLLVVLGAAIRWHASWRPRPGDLG